MTIDITNNFPHKKARVNGTEILIKSVNIVHGLHTLGDHTITYLSVWTEVESRRGNVYDAKDLIFIP